MSGAFLTTAIRDFGTAKEVARVANCSEATAARYRRGETLPDALSLARLMGRSRAIAAAMLRMAGLDDVSMDLEEARLRRELQLIEAKRAGPNHGRRIGDTGPDDQAGPGAAARSMVDRRG